MTTPPSDTSAVDWQAWHAGYGDPDSALRRRLALVQAQLRDALDRAPSGPIRLISICAGQGHDVLGVLGVHPRARDVRARLVELDANNVAIARRAADEAGLCGVEAIVADASSSDSYAGAVPADVVLICGVFGNVAAEDAANTIEHLGQLCAARATVIWTRHRHPPDLVPQIRATFAAAGFDELAFADAPPFGVGAHRFQREPSNFQPGVRLFEFIGHKALWPHLSEDRRSALSALFSPDCTLPGLVEAMRALPHGLPSEPTPQSMLSEGRGTSATKHLFLAQVMAQRFPETEPQLVHRVYTLDRDMACELFGGEVAAAVPGDGLVDVHRYLTAAIDGRRVVLDVTVAGPPWDKRSALPLACGPGIDVVAGADPDAELRTLEREHCDASVRAPVIAALVAAAAPPGQPAAR